MKNKIYVHIGYPKAASTTLQNNLFYRHPNINYLSNNLREGQTKFRSDPQTWEFYLNITSKNELEYSICDNLTLYHQAIQPYIKSNLVNVFSEENLIDPRYGDNWLRAYRLKQVFPTAKIIVILRNQIEIIRSTYEMYPFIVLGPGSEGEFLPFNEWLEINLTYFNQSLLSGLKFYENLSIYRKIFGEKNVGIFLFEELVQELEEFANKISNFLEVDRTKTHELLKLPPRNYAKTHQAYNLKVKLLPKEIKLSKVLPKSIHQYIAKFATQLIPYRKIEMSQFYKKKLWNIYAISNKKLMNEFGIQLKDYDYPL